jgi:hypothetical protein
MSMKQEPRSEWEPDPDAEMVGLQFDRFARRAGASLRSEAPMDGVTKVVRQGSHQRNRRLATEIGVVAAIILSGVALFTRDNSRHSVNLQPDETIETSTSAASVDAPILSADDPRINQWFLDYTGNPVGTAAGDPVKFGVVMPTLLYEFALDSAAKYLNAQAGGVGGRPIVLDLCKQPLTECADRFAADPAVVAVLENQWSGESIGDALAGRKPLHTTYAGSGTTGVGYYPTYTETVTAMALQAEKLTAPGAKVLIIDADDHNEVGSGLPNFFFIPDFSSTLENRNAIVVRASRSKALVDTIRDAGGTNAAAIVFATPPLIALEVHPFARLVCDDFFNALNELAIHPAVIVDGCDPHEGWYKLDVGYNETSPGLQSGALPITVKMPAFGQTETAPVIRGNREIGALLAVIRMINQLGGPLQSNPAALDRAMREFTGPLPLGSGLVDCTPTGKVADRVQPGSCVRFVDVHQFVDGSWVDLPPVDLGS